MARYFIEMAFNGERFHGWQKQPNAVSVQETMEQALCTLLQGPVKVIGAGRTDAGVHASYFVAHFEVSSMPIELPHLVKKLNGFLPSGIVIFSIQPVWEEAHSRFDAISRTYEYHLVMEKNPFIDHLSYRPWYVPDFDLMNRAAARMMNYSDFTSFCRLHNDAKTNLCQLSRAYWEKRNERYVFVVTANRFLRNMVRAMVGTLLEVGRGTLSVEAFCNIIEAQNRSKAGTSAPPQALFLTDIEYPAHLFLPTHRDTTFNP